MVEIEFSVMESTPGEANDLLPLLAAFETQYNIHVNLTGISWHNGWADVSKFGVFGKGPDVSCIGTTWIGSLAAMQTLRPFTAQQVRSVGGADAFFEASWRSGFLTKNPTVWAIPWLGDALVIYYLKNALEKAGIKDAQAAFSSEEAFIETLKIVQHSGCAYPLALTTQKIPRLLHEAALWIWNAGGSLMDDDQEQITFNQPAAMQGWKKYFGLKPFISPETLSPFTAGDLFQSGDSPIHLAGPWMGLIGRYNFPEWGKQLGIASLPGTTYLGGASFVIWQYSKHNHEAFELIRYLSEQPTCIPASPHSCELPTRRNALDMLSAQTDVFHRTYLEALENGKSFPTIRLWGSIERKLIDEIANIWATLFANPDQDLDQYLHDRLDSLAERLKSSIKN